MSLFLMNSCPEWCQGPLPQSRWAPDHQPQVALYHVTLGRFQLSIVSVSVWPPSQSKPWLPLSHIPNEYICHRGNRRHPRPQEYRHRLIGISPPSPPSGTLSSPKLVPSPTPRIPSPVLMGSLHCLLISSFLLTFSHPPQMGLSHWPSNVPRHLHKKQNRWISYLLASILSCSSWPALF